LPIRAVGLLALVLLLAGPVVEAQPAKAHRIGIVTVLSATPEPPTVRAFRQALLELGYVEGKNFFLETRFAEGRTERLPELFAELPAEGRCAGKQPSTARQHA
jgi:putative ABC transport system substrate-binding protein